MTFDKPVTLQQQNATTEQWADVLQLHARVNKTGGSTTLEADADQYRLRLTFEFRYSPQLAAVACNVQPYRVVYRGHHYKVVDYDDYMERHLTIKLSGVLYE